MLEDEEVGGEREAERVSLRVEVYKYTQPIGKPTKRKRKNSAAETPR